MVKLTGTTAEQITVNALNEAGIRLSGLPLSMAIADAKLRKRAGRAALRNFLSELITLTQEKGRRYPK